MRIRKKYQVIPTNAKLENGHSTSDKNGYTCEYINNHSVVVSPTEPTGSARKKVWLQHSNNLAWFNNVTTNSTGTEYRIDNIKPNTAYTITYIKSRISGVTISVIQVYLYNSIKFYNNSGTLLDTISSTSSDIVTLSTTPVEFEKTFTTPANTSYIVFNLGNHNGDFNNNTLISNIMLNAGSTALEYEDYVDDKTFVLNENDIYEEFVPQNEIYSTDEVRIGTWTDGKPLYRKVITGTLGAADSTSYTYTNILPGTIILHNISGTIHSSSNKDTRPAMVYLKTGGGDEYYISYLFPQNSSTGNYNLLWFYSTEYSGFSFELTIEYTKTTDD